MKKQTESDFRITIRSKYHEKLWVLVCDIKQDLRVSNSTVYSYLERFNIETVQLKKRGRHMIPVNEYFRLLEAVGVNEINQ